MLRPVCVSYLASPLGSVVWGFREKGRRGKEETYISIDNILIPTKPFNHHLIPPLHRPRRHIPHIIPHMLHIRPLLPLPHPHQRLAEVFIPNRTKPHRPPPNRLIDFLRPRRRLFDPVNPIEHSIKWTNVGIRPGPEGEMRHRPVIRRWFGGGVQGVGGAREGP